MDVVIHISVVEKRVVVSYMLTLEVQRNNRIKTSNFERLTCVFRGVFMNLRLIWCACFETDTKIND